MKRFGDRSAASPVAAVLLAIVLAALGVSAVWAVRVPIFQEPDELAHADYTFALVDVGRPFVVIDPTLATIASRQAAFLSRAVDYRAMRYNPFARVSAGYGTRSYFRAIDKAAPAPSHDVPRPHARFPYVAGLYPTAFYAFEAAAMVLAEHLSRGSLTSAFLAARYVGVLLLGITLFFSFAIFRRSGLAARESLLATTAVGFFPLVDWVGGYIQPDNLVAALFAAGIAVALGPSSRARSIDDPPDLSYVAIVGAIVTAAVLTKVHYALALWIATVPLVAFRIPKTQRRVGCGLLVTFCVGLPVVAYGLSISVLNPVRRLISPVAWVTSAGASSATDPAPAAIVSSGLHAFNDAFFGGIAGLGFWLHFGMRSGSFVPVGAIWPVRGVIVAATIVTLGLFASLELRLARRIGRIWHRRSAWLACRLTLRSAPVNAYVIVTVMLVAIGAITRGGLVLQGRYWLPVVTSLGVVLFAHLPKLVKSGPRRRLRLALTCAGATYSVIASIVALLAMNADFYGPTGTPTHDSVADIESVRVTTTSMLALDEPSVRRGAVVTIGGYAVDMRTGLPARNVVVSVDGHDREIARVGRAVPRLAEAFNDDAILRAGFDCHLSTANLATGVHVLRFFVSDNPKIDRLAFAREIRLRIT
jgi:hypothetical protein